MVWTTKSPDFAQLFWRLHGSRYVDALPDIDQQLENAIVAWLRSHGRGKVPCFFRVSECQNATRLWATWHGSRTCHRDLWQFWQIWEWNFAVASIAPGRTVWRRVPMWIADWTKKALLHWCWPVKVHLVGWDFFTAWELRQQAVEGSNTWHCSWVGVVFS